MVKNRIASGVRFGHLVVVTEGRDGKGRFAYACKCDCGGEKTVAAGSLRNGNTTSCGCKWRVATAIQVGSVFGRLTVLGVGAERIGKHGRPNATSECLCECGKRKDVRNASLKSGITLSCGCLHVDVRKASATHGHNRRGDQRTSEYNSWACMISRVTNPKNPRWQHYGGRGITVCERWRDFANFIADMGEKPEPKFDHSIERDDVNGNYEPGNCRWATNEEQQMNRANCRWMTFYGKTMILKQWAEISQVSAKLISYRLSRGWSEKRAVWTPPRRTPKSRQGA